MKNLLTVILGLLGVGALTYLCANMHRADIEADLAARTTQSLAGIGLANVQPKAEGQIITLTGEVPNIEAKQKLGDAAAKVWGVEEVRNLLTVLVAPAAPVMTPQQRTEAVNCQGQFDEFLKEPIQFAVGKAEIARGSYPLLNRLAAMAKTCPAAKFEVGGHTDSSGPREMNLSLSKRRAEAVVAFLKTRGIDEARMTSEGYGPDQPIADNKTARGMRQNRRTEFKVKGI
jgi:outer membrane protein OmpA-like peptidoglycan-associated protein